LKTDLNQALSKLLKTETKLIKTKIVNKDIESLKQEMQKMRDEQPTEIDLNLRETVAGPDQDKTSQEQINELRLAFEQLRAESIAANQGLMKSNDELNRKMLEF
jgi:hypothetical protein